MPVEQLSPGQFALENNTRVTADTVDCKFLDAGGGKLTMQLNITFTPAQMNTGGTPVGLDPRLGNCAVLAFDGKNIALRPPTVIAAAVSDANITLLAEPFLLSGLKGKLGEVL